MTDPVNREALALKPCPYCGVSLWRSPNGQRAYCRTDDCFGRSISAVNLDDPRSVTAWNTRPEAAWASEPVAWRPIDTAPDEVRVQIMDASGQVRRSMRTLCDAPRRGVLGVMAWSFIPQGFTPILWAPIASPPPTEASPADKGGEAWVRSAFIREVVAILKAARSDHDIAANCIANIVERAVVPAQISAPQEGDVLMEAEKRGVGIGMVLAASQIVASHGEDVAATEILQAAGLETEADIRAIGIEDYDINILKPVLAEMARAMPSALEDEGGLSDGA